MRKGPCTGRYLLGLLLSAVVPGAALGTPVEPGYTERLVGELPGPDSAPYGGLEADASGVIYAAGAFYPDVYRISPQGLVERYAIVPGDRAVGLALVKDELFIGKEGGFIWKVDTGLISPTPRLVATLPPRNPLAHVEDFAVAPPGWGLFGGQLVVGSNNGIYVLDTETEQLTPLVVVGQYPSISFTPDGRLLAVSFSTGDIVEVSPLGEVSTFFARSPPETDGIEINAVSGEVFITSAGANIIYRIDPEGAEISPFVRDIEIDTGFFPSPLVFSPNGESLYFATETDRYQVRAVDGFPATTPPCQVLQLGGGDTSWANNRNIELSTGPVSSLPSRSLANIDVIFVTSSAGDAATLGQEATRLNAFVQAGGGLVNELGGQMPPNFSWTPYADVAAASIDGSDVLGTAHPIAFGVDAVQLSGKSPSYSAVFTPHPQLQSVLTNQAAAPIALAGPFGTGRTVYLGTLPSSSNDDATHRFMRQATTWAGQCALCGNGVLEKGEQCDDGNLEDGDCCTSRCAFEPQGATCGDPSARPCDNPDQCDGLGACSTNLSVAGDVCDLDNNLCTDDRCDVAANCNAGPPTICDDNDLCSTDSCEPENGCIFDFIVVCPDDGNACNGAEFCDPLSATCLSGPVQTSTVVCRTASNPCDVEEICDGVGNCPPDVVVPNGTSCGNELTCIQSGQCEAGICLADETLDCNDDNPCTLDACSETTGGCVYTNIPDCDPRGIPDGSSGCSCSETEGPKGLHPLVHFLAVLSFLFRRRRQASSALEA